MWLVRDNEQLGKLKRGGLDIVTSLPDVAGWQALNLAGLTEDRIERVVSGLPDAERPCVCNSCDSSLGRAWSPHERERERVGDPRLYVCQAPNAFMCVTVVHFWSISGPFRVHFGSISGPFRVHFGSILGPFRVHFGSISGPFRVHLGSILGPFRVHLGPRIGIWTRISIYTRIGIQTRIDV